MKSINPDRSNLSINLNDKQDSLSSFYFELTESTFIAQYQGQTIILDVTKDEYSSLDASVSDYVIDILTKEFICFNNYYYFKDDLEKLSNYMDNLNVLILKLLNNNFIKMCFVGIRKSQIAVALEPVGLSQVEWMPSIKNDKVKLSFLEMVEAFFVLTKTYLTLRRRGLYGILLLIDSYAMKREIELTNVASSQDLDKVAYLLDRVCLLFPRKILCLVWAAAFSVLLIKRKWHCSFVIGVQTMPFYAHAWVEATGRIVNDNTTLSNRLAPILRKDY